MTDSTKFRLPSFSRRVIVIVGGFGSGKSEIAINLARYLTGTSTKPIAIADLDIVNPYFRSREAADELAALGVKSLIPPGAQAYADLPIILPDISGAIEGFEGTLILDVGGDDVGARVLSSLHDAFTPGEYDLLLVLNANRPFTSDVDGAIDIIRDIEKASRLKFTGIISNTHLMDDTTPDEVLNGLNLAQQVSAKTDLPVYFVSATAKILDRLDQGQLDCPVLPLKRSLLKPWERNTSAGTDGQ